MEPRYLTTYIIAQYRQDGPNTVRMRPTRTRYVIQHGGREIYEEDLDADSFAEFTREFILNKIYMLLADPRWVPDRHGSNTATGLHHDRFPNWA
jgi:hypothetical protein